MRWIALAVLTLPLAAAGLKPRTVAAFDEYMRHVRQRLDSRRNFLWVDESGERARQARAGQVVIEPLGSKAEKEIPDGLVHDWVAAAFLPGISLDATLALVRDYNRHKDIYKPEVMDSRILSHNGNDFRIFLRFLKKKVITVVLNTEHEVHYQQVDKTRWKSESRTTKIAEVENPGKSNEREKAPGEGQGFLWQLNTFWRFEERDGGTWIECEAVSLTRDVPTGLGWLIGPIVKNLPRESLENTMRQTREALAK